MSGGLAGAASDVENSLTSGDGRCGHEPVLVGGDRPVEALGVGRPVAALVTVPRAGLIGVGGIDRYGPAQGGTPVGRRAGHATAARNSSTASGSASRAAVRTGSANPEAKVLATIWGTGRGDHLDHVRGWWLEQRVGEGGDRPGELPHGVLHPGAEVAVVGAAVGDGVGGRPGALRAQVGPLGGERVIGDPGVADGQGQAAGWQDGVGVTTAGVSAPWI